MGDIREYKVFLEKIQRTKYVSIFKPYPDLIKPVQIFEIENQLDKWYFENMIKIAKTYSSGLEEMLGQQIDLNNIVWLERIKKNYEFSEHEIRKIFIPIYTKLKKIELEKLIKINHAKERQVILKQTFYGKFMTFDDINNLEEQVSQYLYHLYQKYFRRNMFDRSVIYAYINMMELENNDIMNVMEGIRYNLSPEEIRKKLL